MTHAVPAQIGGDDVVVVTERLSHPIPGGVSPFSLGVRKRPLMDRHIGVG